MAAAGRCWHGSVAAGHRHGPCNGLVSGIRAQSGWLAVTPHLGAPTGTPTVAAPARGQGTCFQGGVCGGTNWNARRRHSGAGAPVHGGVYRSTLGDNLSPLCSEVGLGRGGLALCSVMVLGGSPLVCVAGFSGVSPASGPYHLTVSFAFSPLGWVPSVRAVCSLPSGPAKDFPSVVNWGSLQRSCLLTPVTPLLLLTRVAKQGC